MGIVRPPWITKEWFFKYTFNYCDHFGDKKLLSKVCKVCADDERRIVKYKLKDVALDFKKASVLLEKGAKKFNIDLSKLPDYEKNTPEPETYPLYRVVEKYSRIVQKLIDIISPIARKTRIKLLFMTNDCLEHSQHYIIAKIGRAFSSRREEEGDPFLQEVHDGETSAFLAYLAIQRNVKALVALSRFFKMMEIGSIRSRETFLEFADVSQDLAEQIKLEFFPDYFLEIEELGCEEYDAVFDSVQEQPKLIN